MLRPIRPLASQASGDSDSRYTPRDWKDELYIEELTAALSAQRAQKILPETGEPTKTETAPVNVPKPQNTPNVQLATGKPTTAGAAPANVLKFQTNPEGQPATGAPITAATAPVNVPKHQSTPKIQPATGAPIPTVAAPANVPKLQTTPEGQPATGAPIPAVAAPANVLKLQTAPEGQPATGAPIPVAAAPVLATKPNNTKFQKGESGNPKGRPRGSRNKTALLREYLLEPEVDELIEKLITLAKEGDKDALTLCIQRLVPRCQERTIELKLGPIMDLQQMFAANSAIFQAVGAGQITPSEGEKLVKMVIAQRDAVLGR